MTRLKMHKIIRLLEKDPNNTQILDPKYRKALLALANTGSVKVVKTWGGEIVRVSLEDAYAMYQLKRSELWTNRIVSFLLGVGTTVLASIIINALRV